jgi:hypothetical protein
VNHFFADTDEYAQVEYEETEIQEHVEHLIKEEFSEFRRGNGGGEKEEGGQGEAEKGQHEPESSVSGYRRR